MKNENQIDPFKVYVRVRPLLERELNYESERYHIKSAVTVENNNIYLVDPESIDLYGRKEKKFNFDNVFVEKDNNNMIFDQIMKNLVENILLGYNSTALAYGVTGTGKTHTMFGDIYLNLNFEKGLCMFAVDYLFDKLRKDEESTHKVKINYLEIYNEQVIDLLVEKSSHSDQHLMIVEDPVKGISVPELTEYIVDTSEQVQNLIILGNSRRTMASTGANQFSSRSHAILQINVEQKISKDECIYSKLLLVDLAGSERGSAEKGIRREEGANINKSLLALGNCINILSDKTKKGSFVPYRDSKLTRLLKDSLGGNILTVMIACISPASVSYDETLNTLQYASRARRIQKKVTKNIKDLDPLSSQCRELIENLKSEIVHLKEIINNQNILLRNRPIDSFRDDREFNVNLNLNLNIGGNKDARNNNNNNLVPFSENFDMNLLPPEDEDFDNPEFKAGYNIFDIKRRCEVFPNQLPISNLKSDFNYENYEEFLHKNLNQLNDNELEDFEKKLELLYFDKINLESQILNGIKDSTLEEKYTIVKSFYEKYIELLNEKMIENIEQNMILKLNLKEILELNNINNNNLKIIQDQIETSSEEEKIKLLEEKENIEANIQENEKEKENISQNLEKNFKVKNLLKTLMFKFLSNTQMREMRDLQQAFTGLTNDKRELEVKNKKYQEFLNTVMKEKEDKDLKIIQLNKEVEILRRKLIDKEKKIVETESRNRDLESVIKDQRVALKRERNAHKKGMTKRRRVFYDDTELKFHSTRKFLTDKILHGKLKHERKRNKEPKEEIFRVDLLRNSTPTLNINLSSKIPRVTATLHDYLENDESQIGLMQCTNYLQGDTTISNLKNNLKTEKERKSSKSPKKNDNQIIESQNKNGESPRLMDYRKCTPTPTPLQNQSYGNLLMKSQNQKSQKSLKVNLLTKFHKDNVQDKIPENISSSNYTNNTNNIGKNITNSHFKPTNKNANSSQNINQVLNKNYINNAKNIIARNDRNSSKIDSISISAVTYNNEICLNASELEIMDNVLDLDGIKNKPKNSNSKLEREKLLTPVGKLSQNNKNLLLGVSPKNRNSMSNNTDIFQNALKAMQEQLEVEKEKDSVEIS